MLRQWAYWVNQINLAYLRTLMSHIITTKSQLDPQYACFMIISNTQVIVIDTSLKIYYYKG